MYGDRLSRPVGLADLLIVMARLKPETPEDAIARTLGYERKKEPDVNVNVNEPKIDA